MTRGLTRMELRCVEKALEVVCADVRVTRAVHANALAIVRAVIREMRIPNDAMIAAMKSAMWKSGLPRGGSVTTTLKHQLRWAAAIDEASPEIKTPTEEKTDEH